MAVYAWRNRASHWAHCIPVLLLAITVALASTLGVGVGASWFDEQRVLLSFAILLAGVLAWVLWPPSEDMASAAVFSGLACGLLSALFAVRPFVAAVDWSMYCLIGLLVRPSRAPVPSMLRSAVALVAALVAGSYVAGVLGNYVASLLLDFPIGGETLLVGFSNPRFPAQLQALTIPLLPLAYRAAPTAFWRTALAIVAALWWMCFIGSGSRTAWIAVAMSSMLVAFLGTEGRRWLKAHVAFAVAGGLLWFVLFHLLPPLLGIASAPEVDRFSNFASVGARLELWRLSIDYALANPLLGVGPMHFAYVDNGLGAHPHNFWLQLLAEWGVPATLLIGGATVALVVGLWRRLRSETDPSSRSVGVALFAAVIAWGVGTLSDGYMVIPTSQAMSTVVLMLAVMWLRLGTPAAVPSTASRVSSAVAMAFTGIALAVLATLPFTEFGQPTGREQAWRAENPGQTLWPRFWQQGWIGPDADPTARPGGMSPLRPHGNAP